MVKGKSMWAQLPVKAYLSVNTSEVTSQVKAPKACGFYYWWQTLNNIKLKIVRVCSKEQKKVFIQGANSNLT